MLHNDLTKQNSLEIIGEMLDTRMFNDFAKNLNDAEESGLKMQKTIAEIQGPAIQVILISFFTRRSSRNNLNNSISIFNKICL